MAEFAFAEGRGVSAAYYQTSSTSTVGETSGSLIQRYIEDAIAAEKSFEARLRSFAEEGDDVEVQAAFLTHAEETRVHQERLAARLRTLGGGTSAVKSFLDQLFAFTPKSTQVGHSQDERLVQNLMWLSRWKRANARCMRRLPL